MPGAFFFPRKGPWKPCASASARFLRVTDESGRKLLFRYYDPRVLPIYLPTCTNDELTTIFGPVDRFVTETEDGAGAVEFSVFGSKTKEGTNRIMHLDCVGALAIYPNHRPTFSISSEAKALSRHHPANQCLSHL